MTSVVIASEAKQSCLCAIIDNAPRSAGHGHGPGCGGAATVSNRGGRPRREQGSGAVFHLTPEQLPGLSPAVARRG